MDSPGDSRKVPPIVLTVCIYKAMCIERQEGGLEKARSQGSSFTSVDNGQLTFSICAQQRWPKK